MSESVAYCPNTLHGQFNVARCIRPKFHNRTELNARVLVRI